MQHCKTMNPRVAGIYHYNLYRDYEIVKQVIVHKPPGGGVASSVRTNLDANRLGM